MTGWVSTWSAALGRGVLLRPGTADERVWADTFTGLYHLPPVELAPATVLDVGANIGLTAAHYRALWPDAKIVAVEMDAGNAALARRNAPDVAVMEVAVGAKTGLGRYDRAAATDAYRLARSRRRPSLAAPSGWVEVMALGDVIRSCFDGPVDFAKLDVEGAEWEILEDAGEWGPLILSLLVELHDHGAPPSTPPLFYGRDGPSPLLAPAVDLLERAGFDARPDVRHPAAVWAVRR